MSSHGGFLECYECGQIIGGDAVWIDPNCNRLTKGYYGEPFHRWCVPEDLQGYDAIDPDFVTEAQGFFIIDGREQKELSIEDKEIYDAIAGGM